MHENETDRSTCGLVSARLAHWSSNFTFSFVGSTLLPGGCARASHLPPRLSSALTLSLSHRMFTAGPVLAAGERTQESRRTRTGGGEFPCSLSSVSLCTLRFLRIFAEASSCSLFFSVCCCCSPLSSFFRSLILSA